ncbi:MAG: hypothetical protein AAFR58_26345 [Cyanobacteria bacterium J06627_28]
MFIPSAQGAAAPTVPPATSPVPSPNSDTETVRHLLFGSLTAVQTTIHTLHKRGYAEPNDWSQPISTGRPNEVMAILTKRIRLENQ